MSGIRDGCLPDRLLDALETDGGWMTTTAICDLGLGSRNSVRRALYQLRNRHGVIKSQPRPTNGRFAQPDNEWRAI